MHDSCLQGHHTLQFGVSAECAASSSNAENLYPVSTSHTDNPQDHNLQIHQCEKLKSTIFCDPNEKGMDITEKRANNINLTKLTMGRSGLLVV
jgi:hypothetical protein